MDTLHLTRGPTHPSLQRVQGEVLQGGLQPGPGPPQVVGPVTRDVSQVSARDHGGTANTVVRRHNYVLYNTSKYK